MLHRIVVVVVVLACAGGLLFGQPSERTDSEVDIAGIYRAGQADVRITKNGSVYQVRWDYPNGQTWIGVGLLEGDTFAIAWDFPFGGNLGVCAYELREGMDGIDLVGHWAAYQDSRPTADTLIFVRR